MLRGMRTTILLALAAAGLVACAAPKGAPPSSTGRPPAQRHDSRVRSFVGQVPPEIAGDARWLSGAPSSLAALRGRVVYLQFAFPT